MRALIILSVMTMSLPTGVATVAAAAGTSNCNRPNSDFDTIYCERKVFMQADNDLNAVYAKLRARLNTADQLSLRTGQRAWIRKRDDQCGRTDDENIRIDIKCAKRVTIDRTNWLNDRVRECTSSGCRSRLLRD